MENLKQYLKKALIAVSVTALVTLFSMALYSMGIRAENIFMLYTFGILIIIIETKEYAVGVVSSLIMVGIFNYFFTEPRFTLRVNDRNYLISFVIFLIVSVIVTSLTIKIQKQVQALEQTQKHTDILYKVSSGYLHVSGVRQVVKYGLECLQGVRQGNYILFVNDFKKNCRIPYSSNEGAVPEEVRKASEWCFLQSSACGKGTRDYPEISYYMMPIVSKGVTYGVLAEEMNLHESGKEEEQVIESIVSLIAMALDREYANEAEQESKLSSEREHLRNNLLRSISHDLRTPLAGITGSASFLLESYHEIDDESRDTLLRDILNDSVWLSQLVDNLLNMTRIQDGRLKLRYENEVVDDIVSEVSARIQKRLGDRIFDTDIPQKFMSVPMDGQLIIQVIVNLIDNSIKHTTENGHIRLVIQSVKVKEKKNKEFAKFEVIDDGSGIDPQVQEHMFESFVTTDTQMGADSGRGIGLGLSIAKEIVKAHHGMLGGRNNEDKGASVYFLLPLERKNEHE